MGLDNGVCVRRNEYTNNIPELKRFESEYDKEHTFNFEVVYFRKCWNIRNDILALINKGASEEYRFNLAKDDIDKIIKLFESYNSKNFTGSGNCIWDWDDEDWPYSEKIAQDIEELKILRELMDKYDLEVYFYDSY